MATENNMKKQYPPKKNVHHPFSMATSYIFHGHESLHKYRQILNSHLGEDTPELIEPNKIMVFEGLLASVTRSIAFWKADWVLRWVGQTWSNPIIS